MKNQETRAKEVTRVIDALIQAGTTFDLDALDRIFHDRMIVLRVEPSGDVSSADKAAFRALFEAKQAQRSPPLDTWAQYLRAEASEREGHVLIKRKVNLSGQDETLMLSIDLVHEDDRWQVTREVIFVQPDGAAA